MGAEGEQIRAQNFRPVMSCPPQTPPPSPPLHTFVQSSPAPYKWLPQFATSTRTPPQIHPRMRKSTHRRAPYACKGQNVKRQMRTGVKRGACMHTRVLVHARARRHIKTQTNARKHSHSVCLSQAPAGHRRAWRPRATVDPVHATAYTHTRNQTHARTLMSR